MELTPGQRLALFWAAQQDSSFTLIERALAAQTVETIEARRSPVPGLLVGQLLTESGRGFVRASLPEPSAATFPYVVADVLRRLRGEGHMCSSIVVEPVVFEGRSGWRVSWEGDGWQLFSRQSDLPEATLNREELERAAQSLGLVIEPQPAPTLLAVTPTQGEIVIKRDSLQDLSPLDRAIQNVDRAFAELDAERDTVRRANLDAKLRNSPKREIISFEQLMASLPAED